MNPDTARMHRLTQRFIDASLEAMWRIRAEAATANTPHHCDYLVRAFRR